MKITQEIFDGQVEEWLSKHFKCKKVHDIRNAKLFSTFFLDPVINEYLRRPIEIIDGVPRLDSKYEVELYTFPHIVRYIPYRSFICNPSSEAIEYTGLQNGLNAFHYFSSVFSGIYSEKKYANYKNIWFFSKQLDIQGSVDKAQEIAKDVKETTYCITPLYYHDHYANLVITIKKEDTSSIKLIVTHIDSHPFHDDRDNQMAATIESRLKIYNVEYNSILMGLQTHKGDNCCSIYGLNIAKAAAQIGLEKQSVIKQHLISKLPMYYDSEGNKKEYAEIKEYHTAESWEIGNRHLLNRLNNDNVDETLAMENFIFVAKPTNGLVPTSNTMLEEYIESKEEATNPPDIEIIGEQLDQGVE